MFDAFQDTLYLCDQLKVELDISRLVLSAYDLLIMFETVTILMMGFICISNK
jgi:hypothetical protein